MDIENDLLHHPKTIWYWVGSERLWYLPYTHSLTRIGKSVWEVKGGADALLDLNKTSHILFYGANENTGSLPLEFLSECADNHVGITIHRNHIAEPLVLYRWNTQDRHDLISAQILQRENAKSRAFLARTFVKWQWQQREWLCTPLTEYSQLASVRNSKAAMQLEAKEAKNYWLIYFRRLGVSNEISRRSDHIINQALDALSHFLSGLTLRWVISHGLSPAHGYLHESTSYPSLVYDLMEITRWITEKAVFETYQESGELNLVARSTQRFKEMLEEHIQTEPTRQTVKRKVLIQGGVIALRHYLEKRMRLFLPPVEQSATSRGRKRNCSYSLPGEIWKK